MTTRMMEILVGVFVAIGLASLFMLAMKVSNLSDFNQSGGYTISARFENIGGLKVKSPVTVSGVRVGRVIGISYDSQEFNAVVTMQIDESYNDFPIDTSASIYTAGLLGEQYIALEPGAEDDVLA
ncbi:MAG: outer membrane lipid asymmetry maintenance protein MlaD, partial [Gammaproteobacteria bacterium]|nr:outer membrane lipid asymmetry maintenance protein MlaD [Gammaproteobacteria bacterium]